MKNKKPIIGVTVGEIVNKDESWSPVTYGQSRTYIDAVINNGGVPIILPIADDEDVLEQLYRLCDGLLVSGGNDPDPELYGEKPHSSIDHVSRRRDDQEIKIINWALNDDKPMLGICRGMQLINIALGGDLYQDIPSQIKGASNHKISSDRKSVTDLAHNLKIDPNSYFAKILGQEKIWANAHHHQAVRRLGQDLKEVAWAEDGVIEAIELPSKQFVVAVQSHPESLESSAEPTWAKLFKSFIDASR